MSVEVLSPHNCLREPSSSRGLLSSPPPMKQNRSPNPTRPSRRKPQQQRKPARPNNPSSSSSSFSLVQKPAAALNMVNGPIKILQRGEELPKLALAAVSAPPPAKENRPSPQKQKSVPDLGSAKRPEKAQKQQKTRPEQPNPALWYYAGSITSPPPSSLPLPSFFKKKDEAASAILKAIGLNLSGL